MTALSVPLPTSTDCLIVAVTALAVLLIAVWWTGRHEHKSGERG